MVLGIDLDNTIICYDQLFHQVALERSLIPADLPVAKIAVREYLRQHDQEKVWTELQAHVYGPRLPEAPAFPGAVECCTKIVQHTIPLFIISHKTQFPVAGPPYDLHQAARDWLASHGFFDPKKIGLSLDEIRFTESREAKIKTIAEVGCTHFIDDLPETFVEPNFPTAVKKILFAPLGQPSKLPGTKVLHSWEQIEMYVFRHPQGLFL